MVRNYYKVDKVAGKWAIIIAKGKKRGLVVAVFDSNEEAWKEFELKYNNKKSA